MKLGEVTLENEEKKKILRIEVRIIFKTKEESKSHKEFEKMTEDVLKSEKETAQEAILPLSPTSRPKTTTNSLQSISSSKIYCSPLALFLQYHQIQSEYDSNEDRLTDGIIFGIQSISKPLNEALI